MVETIPAHGKFCKSPEGWGATFVCKKRDTRGRADPFTFNIEHGGHLDWDGLFAVRQVVFHIRKWDVGKWKLRAQDIGFPHAIKEVWKRQKGQRS